jgi:predicted kinase
MPENTSNDWTFPFSPEPPNWSLDWDAIVATFDWVRAMDGCAQDPVWHAEGDVLVHTRMVCEALCDMDEWRNLPPEERSVLFAAALLHDVAKPVVQREEWGRIRTPRHAAKGARMARTLLWQQYLPTLSLQHLQLRERAVGLVRHHGLPLYLLDESDPRRAVITASQVIRLDRVALLAEVDVLGRRCDDQRELLDRVQIFRDFARENRCYASPRRFASDHTRRLYFEGQQLDPDCEVYDDTHVEVTVMSGLPASGKDRWIAEHACELPVVSLDDIRQELGVSPEDNQGAVAGRAKQRARVHLRRFEPFVWNATNVTRPMRGQLVRLFRDYRASVSVVYTETTWDELLKRNLARTASVPETVLERLATKLDVPDMTEAHQVKWSIS